MKFAHTIQLAFFSCLTLLIFSCGGKAKKYAISSCDSLEAIYKLKTVSRLAEIKDADSVLFQATNNKCYLVISKRTELKEEHFKGTNASFSSNNPADSDKFNGTERKAAKTSVANAYTLEYKNLTSFIKSLPSDSEMGKAHVPDIRTDSNSRRVDEEKKNVHINESWIYAISIQPDGDYRLIVGDSPDIGKAIFFNIVISGLPEENNSSYVKLSKARQTFKDFFGIKNNCKKSTVFILSTPVEIEFSGSLFFDKFNFDSKSENGYKNFKPKSYWEIHPITKIKFL
ncbi:MAG: hypothetical protein ABR968_11080 [Bacteroidales bacterium]|jgi:hypothetical protein